MNEMNISISKAEVYNEVTKTTHYSGAKAVGEDPAVAFDRIALTSADQELLDRYWGEACAMATECVRQFVETVGAQTAASTAYTATLSLPPNYDTRLNDSVLLSLKSFFVNYIVAKWNMSANKPDVSAYMTEAGNMLSDVRSKIYYRKRPTYTRPGTTATETGADTLPNDTNFGKRPDLTTEEDGGTDESDSEEDADNSAATGGDEDGDGDSNDDE